MKKAFFILFLICFSLLGKRALAANPDLLSDSSDLVSEEISQPVVKEPKSEMAVILEEQPLGSLGLTNFLKYGIRYAVDHGVPANTVILILLLPLMGAFVGLLQNFVGLPGFGIFMPAMIAVSFLATGILGGLILFAVILLSAITASRLLRKVRLHYWPRRAISLMIVSLITFAFLLLSPALGLMDLTHLSIFPILFLILLSEEFIRTQLGKSKRNAISLTLGTLIIAIFGASLMAWENLQKLILLNPEISFLIVLALNLFIGKYGGWRILEYRRFETILKKK